MRLWQVRTSPLVALKLAETDKEPYRLSRARYRPGIGDCDGLVVVLAGGLRPTHRDCVERAIF